MDHKLVVKENNVPVKTDNSPATIMANLMSQGATTEAIDKMMELQFKWEANEAKKAYFEAVAEFKKNPPKIWKDSHVNYKAKSGVVTDYNHATLGNITEIISSSLAEHGLSVSWKQLQEGGSLTVICKLTHRLGYSESTSMTAPPDTSGGKNSIQAIASTNSYLCRYTILAITGLATHDMDDDARAASVQFINDEQIKKIEKEMMAKNVNFEKFCKYRKIKNISQIESNMYKAVMIELKGLVAS